MVCFVRSQTLQKCSLKNLLGLLISVSICGVLHVWLMQDIAAFLGNMSNFISKSKQQHEAILRVKGNMKYILLWGPKPKHLRNYNCSVSNCTITEYRGLLSGDYSLFDAVVFSELDLNNAKDKPIRRDKSQIYVFASIESSANYPSCELHNDDFFNWTFTYRLDSDVVWSYFKVRDVNGDIVAPFENVKWDMNTEYPVHEKIKAIFQGRKRAAAWIVSNCNADSLRDDYLSKLQEHLFHYSLRIDVFGKCTKRQCDNHDCDEMVRTHYHFYMAFENSFAVDYVTEKVLRGYDNYVVPIVYGGANYSRFLPPGSYINAREFHPYNLAHVIYTAVKNAKVYEDFFQWTNFYTIRADSSTYHPMCSLCKAMNEKNLKNAPAKKKFRTWWNTLDGMKWCLPQEFWNETSKLNTDGTHIYKNIY